MPRGGCSSFDSSVVRALGVGGEAARERFERPGEVHVEVGRA